MPYHQSPKIFNRLSNYTSFLRHFYLLTLLMTCSMSSVVITPIAKPLQISGSMTEGTMPRGMSWQSIATIRGRPTLSASPNEAIARVECIISNDAASCVPIKKSRITPITVLGMAVSSAIRSGESAHTMSSSVDGISA